MVILDDDEFKKIRKRLALHLDISEEEVARKIGNSYSELRYKQVKYLTDMLILVLGKIKDEDETLFRTYLEKSLAIILTEHIDTVEQKKILENIKSQLEDINRLTK